MSICVDCEKETSHTCQAGCGHEEPLCESCEGFYRLIRKSAPAMCDKCADQLLDAVLNGNGSNKNLN